MVFYLLLFAYYIFIFFGHKTSDNKVLLIVIYLLPLFVLTAFRDISIGPDTSSYYFFFYKINNCNSLADAFNVTGMEPGFVIINFLATRIHLSYYSLQFIFALFIYFSFGKFFLDYSNNIPFSCFFFIANNYFFGIMNVLRMWLAISILLYSVRFIKSRQLIPFLSIVLLAMMFHYSAAFFLLLYPLASVNLTLDRLALVFIVSLVILLFAVPVFTFVTNTLGMYEGYISEERFDVSNNIAIKLSFLVTVCFFVFSTYIKWSLIDRHLTISGNLFVSNISLLDICYAALTVSVCLHIIGLSNNVMGRVINYYDVFLLILIPDLISVINSKKNRILTSFVISSLLFIKFIVVLEFRPEWYQVLPYKFFWS